MNHGWLMSVEISLQSYPHVLICTDIHLCILELPVTSIHSSYILYNVIELYNMIEIIYTCLLHALVTWFHSDLAVSAKTGLLTGTTSLVIRELTYWGQDKMASMWLMPFSKYFLLKILVFFKISLKFVTRGPMTDTQAFFRQWLGIEQGTSHYLNHGWLTLLTHLYASLCLDELTQLTHQGKLNPLHNCFENTWKIYSHFLPFVYTRMAQIFKTFPPGNTGSHLWWLSPYHGCWWPGSTRSQGSSVPGIKPVPQWMNNMIIIISLLCQNDVTLSLWHNNDVIITLCAHSVY